ncbi:hypothetical protein CLF_107365 [Clonorchis sinensis]|uniref:Uncharacterized protein n=1 Tax=Clonorchis sinensis TaxID=79923 RepID=G7YGN3_CLOSI|nr:hypothetical protein CLF_107365 [Clonorchis sinensis]
MSWHFVKCGTAVNRKSANGTYETTILDLARKNRNVLFKYMRHRRRNKPSAFSLRDRNGEPTSDPIVVSEFYRDHYADAVYSVATHSSVAADFIEKSIQSWFKGAFDRIPGNRKLRREGAALRRIEENL